MKKARPWNRQERRIVRLAWFFRYGYFGLMLVLLFVLGALGAGREVRASLIFGMMLLYGLYFLIGLRLRFRHLYCVIENANHQRMTPGNRGGFTKSMRRDILGVGWIFVVIGTACLSITLLKI